MQGIIVFLLCLGTALGQQEACGGVPLELNASVPVVFYSPGFNYSDPDGSFYGEDILCEYRIFKDDPDTQLQLSFFNFSVEGCSDCACDSVTVYDGADDSAPLVRTLCGSLGDVVPEPTILSGDFAFVRFTTNNYATDDKGFLGRAGFPFNNNACEPDQPQVITDPRPGFFFTKNYPVNYENDMLCSWQFQAPVGQTVEIAFYDFQLESCCNCDFMQVYNGASAGSPNMGRWYDQDLPARILSSTNELFINFEADFSITFPGFFAFYRFL